MLIYNQRKTVERKGHGLLNTLINKLPFEAHIPSYNFCGPGTKLQERLKRGDRGINQLDEACRTHDIAYSTSKDLESRHKADKILRDQALVRVGAKDSSIGERLTALGIAGIMHGKRKLGMGVRKRKVNKITLASVIRKAKLAMKKKKTKDFKIAADTALHAVKPFKNIKPSRIIPIPKTGGILPLIPIFAGLSALGALAGGASSIATAVNKAKAAQQKLTEDERHNKQMESIALGKGLHVKRYKKGYGLFLQPNSYYLNKKNFN